MNYPMTFKASSSSLSGISTHWQGEASSFPVGLSIPPEFEGPGGALSPEDLFCLALTNCFLATFKVYAQYSKLSYGEISLTSELVIDLDENKRPVMKKFNSLVKINGVSQIDRALMLAKKTAQSGFILNSVKTECHFEFEIQP